MYKTAFDTLFDAYFGLHFAHTDPNFEGDCVADEHFVSLDTVTEGDTLQHASGTQFSVLAVNEATDGVNTLLVTAHNINTNYTFTATDEYLSQCYRVE